MADRCAYAEGVHGIAGCGDCIECLRYELAQAHTLLCRVTRYVVEDEVVSPRSTRLPRLCEQISRFIASPVRSKVEPSARAAARARVPLGVAEVQALEHALTITERERDDARAAVERLTAELDMWRESADMACETPDPKCECSGCAYAREQSEESP